MKVIKTDGVYNFTEIEDSGGWYWCCDYASGDLFEAEELYHDRHEVQHNRLIFIHYPEGRVVEPMKAEDGQYFGAPAFDNGRLQILMVDFPEAMIRIFQYDDAAEQTDLRAEVPLTGIKDCYNLMLNQEPLMLTRCGNENLFQVVWPEKAEFYVENTEAFCCRDGEKLYFSRWFEDPDYREETVLRDFSSGKILEIIPGCLLEMPDGQKWILQ